MEYKKWGYNLIKLVIEIRRLLLISLSFFVITFSLAPMTIAYPQDQFDECMLAAKANSVLVGVNDSYIEGFCDCALTAILDDQKNDVESVNQCAKKTLNKE